MLRAFARLGWTVARHTGSHAIVSKPILRILLTLDDTIVELIVTFKRENPAWGFASHLGRAPADGHLPDDRTDPSRSRLLAASWPLCFDRMRAAAKDAPWVLDFGWMKSVKRGLLQALLVIDTHARELLDVRFHGMPTPLGRPACSTRYLDGPSASPLP
jgi:hypothetical protein